MFGVKEPDIRKDGDLYHLTTEIVADQTYIQGVSQYLLGMCENGYVLPTSIKNYVTHDIATMESLKLALNKTYGTSILQGLKDGMNARRVPQVKRILVSVPCTIVFWADNTKTVVRCPEGKDFSEYEAFTAALAEKVYGSNSQVKKEIARKLERQVEKDA